MTASNDQPRAAVFRLPKSAYLAVLFFAMGITVFVRNPWLALLWVLPLLVAVYIARVATSMDAENITVTALFGRRSIPWSSVTGLIVNRGRYISAVVADNTAIRLPYVRVRHLPMLTLISGERVPPIPTARDAEDAPAQ